MATTTLEARREQANALLNAERPRDAIAVLDKTMSAAPALLPNDRIHLGMELVRSDAIAALGDRPRALRMQQDIHARALATYGERDKLTLQAATSLAVVLARSGEIKAWSFLASLRIAKAEITSNTPTTIRMMPVT